MLSDLAVGYAAEGHTVSAIARDVEGLQLLSARANGLASCINPISIDYRDLEQIQDHDALSFVGVVPVPFVNLLDPYSTPC
jgi:hypothetical protein